MKLWIISLCAVLSIVLLAGCGGSSETVGRELPLPAEELDLLDRYVQWDRAGLAPSNYPHLKKVEYCTLAGKKEICLIQEPAVIRPDSFIFIYLHGMGKDETQGMILFPLLRETLSLRNAIYVSPRSYDVAAVRDHLLKRYGRRKIFLAGASRGGKIAYEAAMVKTFEYAGLFLIGPALSAIPSPGIGDITVPTYLIYGDRDGANTDGARTVAAALKEQNVPCLSHEINGGGHNAPYREQFWWTEAFEFMGYPQFLPGSVGADASGAEAGSVKSVESGDK